MQHPEYFYYAAMFGVVAPAAWLGGRAAGAIFAYWVLAKLSYEIGIPEGPTRIILYSLVFGFLAIECLRELPGVSVRKIAVTVSFVLLAAISCRISLGFMDQYTGWWLIYWISIPQAMIVFDPRSLQLAGAVMRSVGLRRDRRAQFRVAVQ